MEALYVILGAILALAAGVLTYHVERHYSQLEAEARLLFEIEKVLLEIGGTGSEMAKLNAGSVDPHEVLKYHSMRYQHLSLIEKLHLLAIQITSKKHLPIALRATKFALEDHLQTEENRGVLIEQVQMALNAKLINRYHQEMEKVPNVF